MALIGVAAVAVAVWLLTRDGDEPTTTGLATTTVPATNGSTTSSSAGSAAPAYEPVYEPARCAFDVPAGEEARCGYMEVPENRSDPGNGKTVRIHVAVFPSTSDDPAPDPIVYLEGGPGGEPLEALTYSYSSLVEPFLAQRDVVVFDQRGTGFSTPTLACPEYREVEFQLIEEDTTPQQSAAAQLDALGACRTRLVEEGVDLDAYTSAESAADVADLRRVLGYEEWNLYGISYGTRLALTIMRDHPDGIRSVVLDSTLPPQVDAVAEGPLDARRAMDVLFDGCAADPGCATAYPDLENRFFALVDRLDAEPIRMGVVDPISGRRFNAVIDGDSLIGLLFQGLYATEVIPALPEMIAQMEAGDTTLAAALAGNLVANGDFLSVGMLASVQCSEEVPFSNPNAVRAALDAEPELEGSFVEAVNAGTTAFQMCALWDVAASGGAENAPVSSALPTLIMAGQYDPVTPPSWGRLAGETLSNSVFVEFPGVGHGASLGGDCPRSVMLAFFDDPTRPPDTACVTSMTEPVFVIGGEQRPVTLVPFSDDVLGVTVSGVVPEGWEDAGFGAYARAATGLDPTAILQQAVPGVPSSGLVNVLAGQLGAEAQPAGTYESQGRTWSLYRLDVRGQAVDLGAVDDGDFALIVVLFTTPAEHDVLYASVFLPALDAIKAG